MTNKIADRLVANKLRNLTPVQRTNFLAALQRVLDDPIYSEKIRLARTPVVSQEQHLRQARDLIAAFTAQS